MSTSFFHLLFFSFFFSTGVLNTAPSLQRKCVSLRRFILFFLLFFLFFRDAAVGSLLPALLALLLALRCCSRFVAASHWRRSSHHHFASAAHPSTYPTNSTPLRMLATIRALTLVVVVGLSKSICTHVYFRRWCLLIDLFQCCTRYVAASHRWSLSLVVLQAVRRCQSAVVCLELVAFSLVAAVGSLLQANVIISFPSIVAAVVAHLLEVLQNLLMLQLHSATVAARHIHYDLQSRSVPLFSEAMALGPGPCPRRALNSESAIRHMVDALPLLS
jgi:hypothetical protein